MTNLGEAEALDARRERTRKAREARSRASEQKWADHLRGRGWSVVDPAVVVKLKASLDVDGSHGSNADCKFCQGYAQAISDALGDAGA